jgi:hypothetical protein
VQRLLADAARARAEVPETLIGARRAAALAEATARLSAAADEGDALVAARRVEALLAEPSGEAPK